MAIPVPLPEGQSEILGALGEQVVLTRGRGGGDPRRDQWRLPLLANPTEEAPVGGR